MSRISPCLICAVSLTVVLTAGTAANEVTMREYVGREWNNELIHHDLTFKEGQLRAGPVHWVTPAGEKLAAQMSNLVNYDDGSVKSARVWSVITLKPHTTRTLTLAAGKAGETDLQMTTNDGVLEVTTAKTGARFRLGETTFEVPAEAADVPAYIIAVRQRSGVWGGRGWFETPHKCRSRKVWVEEQGLVYVKVGFEYRFDGYRGEGQDIYMGHVRIAANQELIEIVEDFALGDPDVYRIWKPESRAQEIMWDWWQWRPHAAESNFCFSIYDGLQPTKARWYGHSATIPEKRTGRNPGMDFETDYQLDFSQDRFDISINAYHRGCPDQALSYMAWRAGDPTSDAVGILGLRPTDWQHPDMLPHLSKAIVHHTDTADLRIQAQAKPDLVVKAPLHLGKRVWGIVTLQMPAAGPTEDVIKDGKIVKHAAQTGPSQALQLRAKYGNRQLDKVKDWTLAWESTKTYPSLFVKKGGLEAVLRRVRSSRSLLQSARKERHLAIRRYLLEGGKENAEASYRELMQWCERHIDILFEHGYCSHRGTNNNQYPWWMQEMAARFDLVMGMPEISDADKGALKAYFAFCVNMLQDDDFMPPRTTGVGWGSANMPVNTRGGRAISAAVLSDNPDAKAWFDRAEEYVDALVNKVWAEDGSAISGPHYVNTQADPLLNMALPLYYAGVLPPLQKKYPRIQRFARHLMDRLTPPEPRCDYVRVLPTIGHTRYEYDANVGKYAVLMNLTNPKMAGQMYWLWKRAGSSTHGFMNGIYYMHEEFQASPPQLTSTVYPGSLTFLRNGFPREDETYMAIHVGNHSFDHYDRDIGAFLLYAKGVPLMMDFASMYQPNCWQSIWHNTVSWNVEEQAPKTPCPGRGHKDCWFTGKTWNDHKYKPHHLLDRAADSQSAAPDPYKELGGEMRRQAMSAEVDYVQAGMPLIEFNRSVFYNQAESDNPVPWGPHQSLPTHRLAEKREWKRRFIFVKDDDLQGPNYFVIQDDFDGQDQLSPLANFWCLADDLSVNGNLVHWTGSYGVDLDMFVAYPKNPQIQRREWWHTQKGPARPEFKNGREHQLAAHIKQAPGKGGYTVVLYPRRRYEIQPSFKANADGTVVEIEIGGRRDLVFCSRTVRKRSFGGVTFEGTVGVLKRHPDYTAIGLCEPGRISFDKLLIKADMPVSVRLAQGALEGTVNGAGSLELHLPAVYQGKTVKRNKQTIGVIGEDGRLNLTDVKPGQLTIGDDKR